LFKVSRVHSFILMMNLFSAKISFTWVYHIEGL